MECSGCPGVRGRVIHIREPETVQRRALENLLILIIVGGVRVFLGIFAAMAGSPAAPVLFGRSDTPPKSPSQ
jgi:hypothetical protein